MRKAVVLTAALLAGCAVCPKPAAVPNPPLRGATATQTLPKSWLDQIAAALATMQFPVVPAPAPVPVPTPTPVPVPTPVPTPTPGAYPVSVVSAAHKAVWDLRGKVGPTTPPTKKIGVDALPAGVTADAGHVYLGNGAVLQGWDLYGPRAVFADGTVSLIDCRLGAPGAVGYPLSIGSRTPGSVVTVTRCELDGTGADTRFGALVLTTNRSKLVLTASHVVDARNAAIVTNGGSVVEARGNVFGATGVLATVGAHTEVFHLFSGSAVLEGNLCDMNLGAPQVTPATFTAIVFVEAYDGTVTDVQIRDNILTGTAAIGGYYAIGSSSNSTQIVARLTVDRNLIQAGRNGSFTYPNLEGLVSITGNADFDTGKALLYSATRGLYVP